MTHELGPLPDTELSEVRNDAINQTRLSETGAAYFGSNWREVRKLYTAEQLRAYALAEVEKAVKAEREQGWNDCMALWADHMKRMNDAIAKPLPPGWANHAHHIQQNVLEALKDAPIDAKAPNQEPKRWKSGDEFLPSSEFKFEDGWRVRLAQEQEKADD